MAPQVAPTMSIENGQRREVSHQKADGTHISAQLLRSNPANRHPALAPFGEFPNRYEPNNAGSYSLDAASQEWHDNN